MSFKRLSRPGKLQQVMIGVLESVIPERGAAYVAGPLDSGLEFFRRIATGDTRHKELREYNERRMREVVDKLRSQSNIPVIDPGLLRVPGWSAQEYGIFFLTVIERFVREIWFMDGWEYSYGATKEFIVSSERCVHLLNERGEELSRGDAQRLIEGAVDDLTRLGISPTRFESRLRMLARSKDSHY